VSLDDGRRVALTPGTKLFASDAELRKPPKPRTRKRGESGKHLRPTEEEQASQMGLLISAVDLSWDPTSPGRWATLARAAGLCIDGHPPSLATVCQALSDAWAGRKKLSAGMFARLSLYVAGDVRKTVPLCGGTMTKIGLHVAYRAPYAAYVVAMPDSTGEVETLQVESEAEAWVQGVCAAVVVALAARPDEPEIRVSLRPIQIHRWWSAPWTGNTGQMIASVNRLGVRVSFGTNVRPLSLAEVEVLGAAACGENVAACPVSTKSTPGLLAGLGVFSGQLR
jgi:hypothetical protein